MAHKMILDVDTGIDDALAITYAVADPEIDLIGVIASYGNIEADKAAQNSLKILDLLKQTQVPVFIGKTDPVDHQYQREPINAQIHGDNGIGDVELPPSKRNVEKQNGVDFLIASAKKYGNNLEVVTTGPLTNIASALKKEPKLASLLSHITEMGGALTVPGNVTPVSEANINQDPIAADNVFRSELNVTMVGLDVTLRTLLTRKDTKKWRRLNSTAGEKIADIVDFYIDAYADVHAELGGCSIHDPLAVGLAVDPSYAKFMDLNMLVTTDADSPYYGRTIGDTARLTKPNPNIRVAINVDQDRYVHHFMDIYGKLFQKLAE